jgi:hypothetical protein
MPLAQQEEHFRSMIGTRRTLRLSRYASASSLPEVAAGFGHTVYEFVGHQARSIGNSLHEAVLAPGTYEVIKVERGYGQARAPIDGRTMFSTEQVRVTVRRVRPGPPPEFPALPWHFAAAPASRGLSSVTARPARVDSRSLSAIERGWRAVTHELAENHSFEKAQEVIAGKARMAQQRAARKAAAGHEPSPDRAAATDELSGRRRSRSRTGAETFADRQGTAARAADRQPGRVLRWCRQDQADGPAKWPPPAIGERVAASSRAGKRPTRCPACLGGVRRHAFAAGHM